MRVTLVTDSTADLDPGVAQQLGIDVVPLYVNFGKESFRDRVDITREQFYTRLASGRELPTTSQAPTAAYAEIFGRAAADGSQIVCVSISSKLSGTINAAVAAAAQFPQATIRIVDSKTVSGGLQLLAYAAAELIGSGHGADEIAKRLEELRSGQALFAAIPDLSHAVRTGRISKTMAMIGGMMKILPIIGLDDEGKVVERGRVRTFERALDTLVEATASHLAEAQTSRAVIVHASAPEIAGALQERLLRAIDPSRTRIDVIETGPSIAVHAGIGAAGIFSLRF